MKGSYPWLVVLPVIAGLLLPACGRKSETQSKVEPAHLEQLEGSEFHRVVLTPKAAERLGIETTPVREEISGERVARAETSELVGMATSPEAATATAEVAEFAALTARSSGPAQETNSSATESAAQPVNPAVQLVIPYSAVLYDAHGGSWVYTNPEPLVFVRHPIRIEYIKGNRAVLSEGLPPNTTVVTVGVAELYGTEFEVGH